MYRLATSFPADERFGLCSQLRRAAVSVPTNIVEGSKRQTSADYARFLNIAEASLAETEYLLLLALDLGYVSNDAHEPIAAEIDEVARMLHALRVKVEQGDPLLPTQGSRLPTRGSGASGGTTCQCAA